MNDQAPEPYRGSLDPFEDVSEMFDRMGLAYCIMVGMEGDSSTHVWSNIANWGRDSVECFDDVWRDVRKDALRFCDANGL
jgi:hypothetical protein